MYSWLRIRSTLLAMLLALLLAWNAAAQSDSFRFAILGDRTGEAQPGVYEQVWKEVAAERPAFVVSVGDTIEGLDDARADAEWREAAAIFGRYGKLPLYLAAGNHDIWSPASERLFEKYAKHPAHYSFDYAQAHFTILDNSRTDDLPREELDFLEADLKAHASQPLKIVVSHRPSWLADVAFKNTANPLHQLAKKYGVRYVIAGHIHQMLHFELDGVTYLSMPSAGGHLRLSKAYDEGWFFGHALADVHGDRMDLAIEEIAAPHGEGRVTKLADWGMTGLIKK